MAEFASFAFSGGVMLSLRSIWRGADINKASSDAGASKTLRD
jgi:hypothetical protein